MSQHQFAERRDERKSPEEAKDVGKLHPRKVSTSSVLHKLALDGGAQLVARYEGLGGAEGGQGRLGGAASQTSGGFGISTRQSVFSFTPGGERKSDGEKPHSNQHL